MIFRLPPRRLRGLSALAALALAGCGGGGTTGTNTGNPPLGPSPFTATNYVYAGTFGPTVTGSNAPFAVAVDSSNAVYLTEPALRQVQKFKSDGALVVQFGAAGSGNGQFGKQGPIGVTVDSVGNVYVADNDNHRVEKFKSDGTYLSQFDTKNLLPDALAVDAQGDVYVAGSPFLVTTFGNSIQGTSLVYKFGSDGTFQAQVGTSGRGAGQLGSPDNITIGTGGSLYVSDTELGRVEMFQGDGNFLKEFGTYGSGDGQLFNGDGIAVDGGGNVYVADTDNSRIEKFKSDGTYLAQFAVTIGAGGGKMYPQNVAVDGSGTVYVSDANHPVQVYHPVL